MELTEYLAVLRRYWRIWIGCTLISLLLAAVALETSPRSYEATARVFVSASPTISNSAQFVNQRAKSYPAVAESQAVLGPVIEKLGLDLTSAQLKALVTADNPVDTSQVEITTTSPDPEQAARISNAVAQQMAKVVEDLETPPSGDRPVTLTVNDPATAPTKAVSPVAAYVLGLGLLAGLFVGLAAAVVRSRLDTRLYSELDIRRAWGEDDAVDLLLPPRGRARQSALTGRPAAALARRLELAAEDRPIRVAVLSPSPEEMRAARALAEEVAVDLRGREMPTTVAGPGLAGAPLVDERPHIRLEVTDPLAPLRFWRDVASRYEGVVIVLPRGRVDAAELHEVRAILRNAGIRPLSVVLVGRTRRAARAGVPSAGTALSLPRVRSTSETENSARRVRVQEPALAVKAAVAAAGDGAPSQRANTKN